MDINLFIRTLYEKNLCTWFILPLLGMSVDDFIARNVVNTYLTKDLKHLAVLVKMPQLCFMATGTPAMHKRLFVKSIPTPAGTLFIYKIPETVHEDVVNFSLGKYSKFSEASKVIIKANSTLPYKRMGADGRETTDAVLMALDKLGPLKKTWMDLLNVRKEYMPEELLDVPGERCYIELEIKNP